MYGQFHVYASDSLRARASLVRPRPAQLRKHAARACRRAAAGAALQARPAAHMKAPVEMSATGEAESGAPDEAPYGHKVFEPGQELVSAGQRTGGDEFERRWKLPCAASSAPINILGKPRPGCESRRLGRQKNEKPARQTAQRTSARQLYCGAAILRPRSYPSRLEKLGPLSPIEETSASAASSADMTTHLVMGGCGIVGSARRSSPHSSSTTNQSELFDSGVAL